MYTAALLTGVQPALRSWIFSVSVSGTPVLLSRMSLRTIALLLRIASSGYGPSVSVGVSVQLPTAARTACTV